MCGIVGLAGPYIQETIESSLRRMNSAIVHRGPDDEGMWAEAGFGFAMHRLSIIDLTGGHQPMWDEQSGVGVVYNGEVYNYRELRREMESHSTRFTSTGDTEVVLKGLVQRGADAVQDWNGMFAVACWNRPLRRLTLIRDRIGVKPLYYYWDGTTLAFASEIKALLASNLLRLVLNRQAIWDYLTFRYVPSPATAWQNVWKLPPGHILEWTPGEEPRLRRYWDSNVVSVPDCVDLDQRLREFEELFLEAVELRLLAADVPVGVLLSGGLDSSALAAAAVELGHKRFHTFSVGFDEGGEYSELAYARTMAEHLGAEYHEVIVDRRSFLEMLPAVVRSADEPLADLSTVPLLAVSRLAREWVKVVLSGEGSDELLAGYDFDNAMRHWDSISRMQHLPPFLLRAFGASLALVSNKYSEKFRALSEVPISQWNRVFRPHITRHWLQEEKTLLWTDYVGLDSERILVDLYSAAASPHPLEQMLSVYQKSWLVEDLLMKADKTTMATSLELRVPFLDYRLVEWANRQPVGVKVHTNGHGQRITKDILRRFARKRLPRSIVDRPKRGFPVPAYRWFGEPDFCRWAEGQLLGRESRLSHFLSKRVMQVNLQESAMGNQEAAQRVWVLLILQTWLREYDVNVC